MGRRRFEVRMRQGDTDREIARAGLMGRPKAARLRAIIAADQGWLDPEAPLPEDAAIAAVVGAARRARSTIPTVPSACVRPSPRVLQEAPLDTVKLTV